MSPFPDITKNDQAQVATMKSKQEVAPQLSHPSEPSVRTIPFPGNAAQRMIPRRSTGWDPYEVWRTRVRAAPRDPADEARDKAG